MLLSHETTIKLDEASSNIIGHMCYAASKLWNVCNYERNNYDELGLDRYPDWYYQKSAHKGDIWFKSLPSQTAQEVCKLLDKSWKSFYKLQKTGGIETPRPPRYKQESIAITYMQNGIVHEPESNIVRLSLPKALNEHMLSNYQISSNYLYLKNCIFQITDTIKQIHIYPPAKGEARMIIVYEVNDVEELPNNGHFLSIDLGLHNLMTCYDNSGSSFILGRKYLSITRNFDKEISRVQSQWANVQASKEVKYPKPSKHLLRLYAKKRHHVKDYLHKITRYVADYCKDNDIHTVVVGDITGIRQDNDLGNKTNQKLHGLPYAQIYTMLEYKLKLYGIKFVMQEESYSSQCSPLSLEVSSEYAKKHNRISRGLYKDDNMVYNADAVGAYNILRKYSKVAGYEIFMPIAGLNETKIIKVAV